MAYAPLQPVQFAAYPPQARKLAIDYLTLFNNLPPIFAAILLREIASYDWKFPAERSLIDRQLDFLHSMSDAQLTSTMSGFTSLPLTGELKNEPWASAPAEFSEKLTAYLWRVHQMDRFRELAETYQQQLVLARPDPQPATPRMCIVIVGKDANPGIINLFARLRAHGTYFTGVKLNSGLEEIFGPIESRVKAHPLPYAHWYVDGGKLRTTPAASGDIKALNTISYAELEGVRTALLQKASMARSSGTVGPEDLRSMMARLRPEQLDSAHTSRDPVVRHFELTLLTEGSGTQIFSTTFVQWAGRELLRRAQPLTLVLRFVPRQVNRPMNDLLFSPAEKVQYDPDGSLVDADMAAFYTWINLMRLSGAEKSSFFAWFEERREALVIAPTMAKNTISNQPCTLSEIYRWIT
jgi:hypothetical protein